MRKRKKIVTVIIILFITTLVVFAFLFMPSISLNPLSDTKTFLENNDVIMNDGVFFISADSLELIKDSINEQADTESYKKLEKIVKRNKGVFVNSIVAMELMLAGKGTTAWNEITNVVWTVEQSDSSITINGTPLDTHLSIPKGYKVY